VDKRAGAESRVVTEKALVSEADLGAMLCLAFPGVFPRLRIFRRTVLNVETVDGWRARAGVKGQADYYIMGKRVHVEVETKAIPRASKWYKEQLAWRALCSQLEIPYLIARALPGETPDETVAKWLVELVPLVGSPC
jgi:hypothetical protein